MEISTACVKDSRGKPTAGAAGLAADGLTPPIVLHSKSGRSIKRAKVAGARPNIFFVNCPNPE